jgi:hypothetical protein
MPTSPDCKRFSPVFLPELHAVQARRRRYRIEQLLGFLPQVPARFPEPSLVAPDDDAPQVPIAVSLETLKEKRQNTETAREELAKVRRSAYKATTGRTKDRNERLNAATKFLSAARAWHDEAKLHRDGTFREVLRRAKQTPPPTSDAEKQARLDAEKRAREDWERAEAIFTAAANALFGAAKEVRNEQSHRSSTPQQAAEAVKPDDPDLSADYGLILACEIKVGEHLDKYLREEPSAQDSNYVIFCQWVLELARAERNLYETAETKF